MNMSTAFTFENYLYVCCYMIHNFLMYNVSKFYSPGACHDPYTHPDSGIGPGEKHLSGGAL